MPDTAPSDPRLPLDPDQRRAADAAAESVLVLAGPGTGKTTTLVGRYLHLLDRGVAPARIFVSTFTVRAARDLHRRIGEGLAERGDPVAQRVARLPIGTLHGMASRLLTRVPPEGLAPFRILDEMDCTRLIARHRLYPADSSRPPLDLFSGWKDRLLDPAAALAEARARGDSDLIEAAGLYARYQEVLSAEGARDFGDLIMVLVAALEADPGYRARIAGFFDHLLIDEFQDVNPAQERLLRLLRSEGAHLWAVGDDDQCLYAWRSADPRIILGFERAWPGAVLFRLGCNYRSSATIVGAAAALIGRNRARFPKGQVSRDPSRLALTLAGFTDDGAEAAYVLRVVKGLAGRGLAWGEMAVLYRAGHVGSRIQIALAEAGIPHEVRGSGAFWQLGPVRLVAGLARLLVDPTDHAARALMGHGKRVDAVLEQAPAKVDDRADWPVVCRQVGRLVASTRRPPGEEGAQWRDLALLAADLAAECGSPRALAERIAEARAAPARGGDRVVLSTIHAAKGLEWAAVVVAGCEDGVMPIESAPDPEEERRLMYVAATRARRWLVLTFAEDRRRRAAPSPFIAEMLAGLESEQIRYHDDATRQCLMRAQSGAKPPVAALAAPAPKGRAKGGVRRPKRKRGV